MGAFQCLPDEVVALEGHLVRVREQGVEEGVWIVLPGVQRGRDGSVGEQTRLSKGVTPLVEQTAVDAFDGVVVESLATKSRAKVAVT